MRGADETDESGMNGSTTELDGLLAASRALWRRRAVVRGALWGVLAGASALVILLGAAWAGLVPASPRPWLRWAPLAVLVVLLVLGLLRALLRAPGERAFALRAEESVPELEHLPTTLLDLPADHPYTPDLRRRAADRLRGVTPSRLLDPISSRGGALGAGLIALIALIALVTSGGPTTVWAAWGGSAALGGPGSEPTSSHAPDARSQPLASLAVRVVPPDYTGLPETETPLDGVVSAMAGSRVELSGTGGGPGLDVALVHAEGARTSLSLRREASRWVSAWVLETGDRGLVLTDDEGRERVVPLSAQDDPPPTVELIEPDRDFVLATGTGAIEFHARAIDPLGLADFRLTWVHTRGSGESFDFREGTASWASRERTANGLEGRLVLNLADLGLGPGDVLHLRAVATDRNDVTGPGTGVSETRQIRIIREGEEMSVDALVGFPLELDQRPVLSQRMILLMTEELLERAPELTESAFRAEAEAIADEQTRLRTQVAEQIYSRATGAMESVDTHLGHEGLSPVAETDAHAHEPTPAPEPSGSRYGVASVFDPTSEEPSPSERDAEPFPLDATEDPDPAGTQVGSYEVGGAGALPTGFGQLDDLGHDHDSDPVLSVNRPLLAIHDAMWASEGELRVIDPAASLPHQRLALERLQSLRENERVFPRGRVTVPPVDVEAARGTGEVDDADPAPRSPWSGERDAARWLARLEGALADLAGGAPTLQDTLEELAVELVADPAVDPTVVAPVARATERLRTGDVDGARADLLEARALLDPRGERVASDPESSWASSPSSALGASISANLDEPLTGGRAVAGASAKPFVFATLRYESGNWDSAPLVPQNLIHTLAQYTELPVAPEGVVVDLSSSEIFQYPVLYLTGHLPVRFSADESRNLREYVERGGFVFMDDHNHDVDGAFHRTATAELERIFGRDALEALPSDHEIYRAFFHFEDGPPITAHELSGWGDGLIHRELFAVVRDGRIGVLYSNKDYSSEWSYHAVNKRFLAVDNTRFGVNILLYALTR